MPSAAEVVPLGTRLPGMRFSVELLHEISQEYVPLDLADDPGPQIGRRHLASADEDGICVVDGLEQHELLAAHLCPDDAAEIRANLAWQQRVRAWTAEQAQIEREAAQLTRELERLTAEDAALMAEAVALADVGRVRWNAAIVSRPEGSDPLIRVTETRRVPYPWEC